MDSDIAKKIKKLDKPKVIVEREFEDIFAENLMILKKIMPDDYKPIESDRYMKLLRVISYKEMYSQVDRNDVISQLLITTASDSNLDHLGARFDVFRLDGAKPYALYKFESSKIADTPIVIPAGLELIDESGVFKAKLLEDVVIGIGDDSAAGTVELDLHIEKSTIKTEIITTPLPYIMSAKALEDFENGDEAESDEKYRIRIIRSLGKYSTAGSRASYLYWTYSADSRIDDVSVFGTKGTLEVNVYLHSRTGVDGVMLDRVEENLSAEKVRPLGDEVSVYPAGIKSVDIVAEIELFDLSQAAQIQMKIEENLEEYFFSIGEHLTRTELIKNLQVNNVFRVNIEFQDLIISAKEIIKINKINLTFVEAKI